MLEPEDIKKQTFSIIANQLGLEKDEINLSDTLEELTDSEIELSDLLAQIENHFYITFDEDDKITTVEDLLLTVEDKAT